MINRVIFIDTKLSNYIRSNKIKITFYNEIFLNLARNIENNNYCEFDANNDEIK